MSTEAPSYVHQISQEEVMPQIRGIDLKIYLIDEIKNQKCQTLKSVKVSGFFVLKRFFDMLE